MPLRARELHLRPLLLESYYSAATYLGAFALTAGLWFCWVSCIFGELHPSRSDAAQVSIESYVGARAGSLDTQSGLQLHSQVLQRSLINTTQASGFTYLSQLSVSRKLFSIHPGSNASSSPSSVPAPTPSPDTTTVKVAIIGAIGLILSVTIPVLATTFSRQRPVANTAVSESSVERELRRRAEAAERELESKELEIKQLIRGMQLRDDRIDTLERLPWSHGVDSVSPASSPVATEGKP